MASVKKAIESKSDQVNSMDLVGSPVTIKITAVDVKDTKEQPVTVHYEGENGRPYKPCKSMCRVLAAVYGLDGDDYVGHSITLYCDPTVKWAGEDVGGVRISHMTGITEPLKLPLTVTRGSRKTFTVQPLVLSKPDPEYNALCVAGSDAAEQGVDAFVAWGKTLTPAQRAKVERHLPVWNATAKKTTTPSERESAVSEAIKNAVPVCETCNGTGLFEDAEGKGPCPACKG